MFNHPIHVHVLLNIFVRQLDVVQNQLQLQVPQQHSLSISLFVLV
jgi:hypothetical protein